MSKPTYFLQECPTCGRSLHVRVEYLGRNVACQHCSARFVATDPSMSREPASDSSTVLLKRVDELLEAAERRKMAWN